MNYCVIAKDNKVCTDREIQKRNKFAYLSEAQEYIDDNLSFKTIVTTDKALNELKVEK